MGKITYDFDNKEEREFVDDFYFYRYQSKSFYFDWKQYENDLYDNNKKFFCFIKENCQKAELDRFIDIHRRFIILLGFIPEYKIQNMSNDEILEDLIFDIFLCKKNWHNIKCFKYILYQKFPYKENENINID